MEGDGCAMAVLGGELRRGVAGGLEETADLLLWLPLMKGVLRRSSSDEALQGEMADQVLVVAAVGDCWMWEEISLGLRIEEIIYVER